MQLSMPRLQSGRGRKALHLNLHYDLNSVSLNKPNFMLE